ncbi:MFS transporter [Actinopolymorpha rutila]|uniref:Putative proline/betaine transporter n=1 Tax=Actinopolymorpha rutila TaxID=446787 RepID=A0A852ZU82_9ACTN|nr:MFS transporter [Actinopolymorpha rutila]NYH92226.1 metabolite-proton symporter [Actinopolymorpha rutila]
MTEQRGSLARVAFASGIGSCLEWYDFFIYGTAAAVVFNTVFFPDMEPAAGTLIAFATFGVGFFARPFGGLFFGHIGDRVGRRYVLILTLLLVGGATFLIGFLPSYDKIGVAAPILLVLLRLVQGFGAGAEYSGAVIYAVEHAPPNRRGWFGSWSPMGVSLGTLMAAGVFALVSLLPEDDFLSWGWRIPFWLSIVLVAVGMYLRLHLAETPVFNQARQRRDVLRMPIRHALVTQPRSFVVVIGARFAENGLGYLFPTWSISYLSGQLNYSKTTALVAVTIATCAQFVMVPVWSVLSDRIGRRPVYAGAAAFCVLFAFPYFLLLNTKSTPLVIFAMAAAVGIGVAGMFGPQAAYFTELFAPRVRYSGFAFARELGSILAGGPAPFLASLLLVWAGGAPWAVAGYMVVLAAISLAAVLWGPETYKTDILAEPDRGPAGMQAEVAQRTRA